MGNEEYFTPGDLGESKKERVANDTGESAVPPPPPQSVEKKEEAKSSEGARPSEQRTQPAQPPSPPPPYPPPYYPPQYPYPNQPYGYPPPPHASREPANHQTISHPADVLDDEEVVELARSRRKRRKSVPESVLANSGVLPTSYKEAKLYGSFEKVGWENYRYITKVRLEICRGLDSVEALRQCVQNNFEAEIWADLSPAAKQVVKKYPYLGLEVGQHKIYPIINPFFAGNVVDASAEYDVQTLKRMIAVLRAEYEALMSEVEVWKRKYQALLEENEDLRRKLGECYQKCGYGQVVGQTISGVLTLLSKQSEIKAKELEVMKVQHTARLSEKLMTRGPPTDPVEVIDKGAEAISKIAEALAKLGINVGQLVNRGAPQGQASATAQATAQGAVGQPSQSTPSPSPFDVLGGSTNVERGERK